MQQTENVSAERVVTMLQNAATPATSGDFTGLAMAEVTRLVILILGWAGWGSGVLGNVLIIVTLLSQPALRGHLYNVYVGNLAVADLLLVGYSLPFWLLDLATGHHPVLNHSHCEANACISSLCVLTSIYTLLFIGFNRYLSVCRPRMYQRVFTKTNTIVFCFGIWAAAGALAVMPLFGVAGSSFQYNNYSRICSFDSSSPTGMSNVVSVVSLVVPTLLIGFFSTSIYCSWRASQRRVGHWRTFTSASISRLAAPESGPCDSSAIIAVVSGQADSDRLGQAAPVSVRSSVSNREKQMTLGAVPGKLNASSIALLRSLVIVFCLLVVFYLPLAVGLSLPLTFAGDVYAFMVLLLYINHSVNWVVYGSLNKNFRDGYKRVILGPCKRGLSPRNVELTINTNVD